MLGVTSAASQPGGRGGESDGTELRKHSSATSVPHLSRGGQLLVTDIDSVINPLTPKPPSPTTAPLLLDTASAAQWRRRGKRQNNIVPEREVTRSANETVLRADAMEEVHGVDVSWLHRPKKDDKNRKGARSPLPGKKDIRPPPPHLGHSDGDNRDNIQRKPLPQIASDPAKPPALPIVSPPTPVEPAQDTTHAIPSAPTSGSQAVPAGKQHLEQPKRPGLFSRSSSERVSQDGRAGQDSKLSNPKKSSWMNSLSSKFSSSQVPQERSAPVSTQPSKQQLEQLSPQQTNSSVEEAEPYNPAKAKDASPSFLSSISRRLSAGSQAGGVPKAQGPGSVVPRRVLNVDPNRERVLIPDMDSTTLRKVSFCVDVEVVGGSRYRDDEDDDDEERQRKRQEFKMREKAEGAALKNPETLATEKDEEGEPKLENKANSLHTRAKDSIMEVNSEDLNENVSLSTGDAEEERDAAARKREKKQRSESERKERKEKRRRRAEENGQIPVEVMLDGEGGNGTPGALTSDTAVPEKDGTQPAQKIPAQPQPNASGGGRPTSDPARIYRRCCQLRESPILKRITEQLSNPKCTHPREPGVVTCLDLTGSRLQLADVVSLGDWLAVVPVKQLKLEDADLNDEGIRCILAGLLATKKPTPSMRKSATPKHRSGLIYPHYQERAGLVEKISIKNNPRITRIGWKHISLFIYMCRSLRTIDVSMNQFPETLPHSINAAPTKVSQNAPTIKSNELDAADVLYQCVSQRRGGKMLEELIMSECGLTAAQIRKVVDGAIACRVTRLGFAGNHLDDDGIEHMLTYLRSGICQALDVGGNDLRGQMSKISDAFNVDAELPFWGLSLADCNLDTASVKPLFAQLARLPCFKFLDLSHNRDLCTHDNDLIHLLRRYIGRLTELKRMHLADVGMNPKQAIALADALPDGPKLAHLSLLENPQLTALANAKTESEQEEACAFYASLMAAVRVSNSLVFVDIDVPSADNSEIVKALAKQVVAYSLRNMENFAIYEATGTENATATLTGPHGGQEGVKKFSVPDVLMSLVGHMDDVEENHDNDDPAPDEDYIVGGTGVVKALQYVLGAKNLEDESGRKSMPSTATGALTPKERPGSSAGLAELGKAKKMSTNLLGSARKIRQRLLPALLKEEAQGNDMSYRRLLFLDQTLQSIIQRFEEEYPETRLVPISPEKAPSENSSLTDQPSLLGSSVNTQGTEMTNNASDEEDGDEEDGVRPTPGRKNSDVSIASRHLSMEEGRLHRLGQQLRREVIDSPGTMEFREVPWKGQEGEEDSERFRKFRHYIQSMTGGEMKDLVNDDGWANALESLGGNYEDLRRLQEEDPEGWQMFKLAQETARLNM